MLILLLEKWVNNQPPSGAVKNRDTMFMWHQLTACFWRMPTWQVIDKYWKLKSQEYMRHDRGSMSSPTLLSQYSSALTYHSLWKKLICYACSTVVICEWPPAGLLASANFDSGLCHEMTFGFCPSSIANSGKEVGHKTTSYDSKVAEFHGQTT